MVPAELSRLRIVALPSGVTVSRRTRSLGSSPRLTIPCSTRRSTRPDIVATGHVQLRLMAGCPFRIDGDHGQDLELLHGDRGRDQGFGH